MEWDREKEGRVIGIGVRWESGMEDVEVENKVDCESGRESEVDSKGVRKGMETEIVVD